MAPAFILEHPTSQKPIVDTKPTQGLVNAISGILCTQKQKSQIPDAKNQHESEISDPVRILWLPSDFQIEKSDSKSDSYAKPL